MNLKSKQRLQMAHPILRQVANIVQNEYGIDHEVDCANRTQPEQHAAFVKNNSKIDWPEGEPAPPNAKHCKLPSEAIDVRLKGCGFTDKPKDLLAAGFLAGVYLAAGRSIGVQLRWGADWNMNGMVSDENFVDAYHLEVLK